MNKEQLNREVEPTIEKYPDLGCEYADEFLGGEQSYCLTCPFKKCYEEWDVDERAQFAKPKIIKLSREGKTPKEIAEIVGLSERRVKEGLK